MWWLLLGGVAALGTLVSQAAIAYRAGASLGLVWLTRVDGVLLTARQADIWRRLKAAAATDGVVLRLNSGFRTMAEQTQLWLRSKLPGQPLAARPGYSNHQSGLAFDFDVGGNRADSPQYRWLAKNATRFGLRNTGATFSRPELWHWELS